MEMAQEVLPVVEDTPVLAGVCGTDPFRLMEVFLKQVKDIGFTGIQNFPTVGLIDGVFRQNLEETGMGFGLEVETVRIAHDLDLLTCTYVFNTDEARAMAQAEQTYWWHIWALPPRAPSVPTQLLHHWKTLLNESKKSTMPVKTSIRMLWLSAMAAPSPNRRMPSTSYSTPRCGGVLRRIVH